MTHRTPAHIAVPSFASPLRHAQDHDFKQYFSLDQKAKWPADGLPKIDVGGVHLWVMPLTQTSRQGKPRLFARCPTCAGVISGGRIQQHYKSHFATV